MRTYRDSTGVGIHIGIGIGLGLGGSLIEMFSES